MREPANCTSEVGRLPAAKMLLADHMEHCVLDPVHGGSPNKRLAELRKALERFIH